MVQHMAKKRKYVRIPQHTRKVGKKKVTVRAHIRMIPASTRKKKPK